MPNNEHAQVRPVGFSVMKQVNFSESGEVSEWLKEHAWKVCIRQRIEGSNPSLSANQSGLCRASLQSNRKLKIYQRVMRQ